MDLWICGQWVNDKEWDFQGIFDSEQKAIDACTHDNYWIAPVKLNETYPQETVQMPGAYYPRLNLLH